jgi:PAS domain S-box-containing protein
VTEEIAILQRALAREKAARKAAEAILEQKSLELFQANNALLAINKNLEAEVEKRANEAYLFSLFPMHNPDALFRLDFDGNIILKNPAAEKISMVVSNNKTFTLEEFGYHIASTLHGVNGNQIFEGTANNHYFSFLCCPLPKEQIINIYGRDITKENQVEIELKSTALRISNLIINMQEGILVEDEHRRIILTNQHFCKIFEIPVNPDQLLGTDCTTSAQASKYLFKYPDQFEQKIDALLQDRKVVINEVLELADGRFFERDYIPIFVDDLYKGHLWKYRDISERIQAESKLKIQEEKYRNIIANMNLGLLEVDKFEIIKSVNKSFCDMSGYSEAELIGKNASALLSSTESKSVIHAKNKSRIEGMSDAYEIQAVTKTGEKRCWLISGGPMIDSKGELTGSIGIHLDITDQKILQNQLKEAKETAEQSAKAKEIFLTNMSHEIRTPMNAIMGMGRQLQKTNLSKEQQEYLSAINHASDNLLIIINDILDFSKIEAGKVALEEIGFNLKQVVEQCTQVLAHKAEEKGLNLSCTIDDNIAPVFKGDPYRLNQIFINLLGNAIKFTERGTVSIACVLHHKSNNRQEIKITITDTGIGMDDHFLDILFQKFTQEDESIARRYGGTGLGMSISKQLVELMGGTIEVQSKKNEGTIVHINIGFIIGAADDIISKTNKKTDSGILKSKKILLVEDNEMNRIVAKTILNHYSATVDEAHNGDEAVNILSEKDYDLVLMDVRMPVMDGLAATKAIRKFISKSIPIIALTANAVKGEQAKCLDAGMNDYLSKPFLEEDLINMISFWLGKKDALTPAEPKVALQPVSDKAYSLEKLQKIGNNDAVFLQRMLAIFEKETTTTIVAMKTAYEAGDYKKIGELAHRMKPSILNMCIDSFSNEVRELEILGDSENPDVTVIKQLIEKGESILTTVIQQIKLNELKR